ncbi:class I adenylate-forming enzyme family protein [Microbacterium sp. X-17]|uniref:class I adenylate-forming enzyme family protein n=1 Tax=Microbacterium sp. X-17 TaxID=3144404 RepID=UPI0031F4B07D
MSWGGEVVPVRVGGIDYKMYAERPRRLSELVPFAARWGDRPHIVQGDRVVRFDEFGAAVASRAVWLEAAGIGEGDRVVILGWNSPEWIVNFWAIVSVGAVAVLANSWWSDAELADALKKVEPRAVVAHDRLAARVPPEWPVLPWTADVDLAALGMPAGDPSTDENAPAAIIFTSGTSGTPKAAVLSHRALLAGLQMLLHITRRLPHQVDESAGEAALHTGPMFHVGGIQTLLRAICVGDTLVMPAGKFDPAEAMRLIEAWHIRRWSAVPTMVTRVLNDPEIGRYDLSTLRSLTVGGAPIHADLLASIRTGFPGTEPRIATGYGLTENGGQAVAASGKDTVDRPGATGRALPCVELRIAESAEGTDGEVLLRSPTQMTGYLGADASPIDAEGWLHTGDLGRVDDGYLWITGRSKDMIIRGGENIAPAAVEAALVALPTVDDALVFGLPNPDLGEEVAAIVVPAPGFDQDEVARTLRATIAGFSVPTRWFQADEPFPLTHSGKVDKNAVVSRLRAAEIAG